MIILNQEDSEIIMNLARDLTGTKVNSANHGVIVQNVSKRISDVGCHNLEQYLKYVDEHDEEVSHLLSAVTIHTTGWFRESSAFDKLEQIVQDKIQERSSSDQKILFKLLCVACSTGEEVYSLAATLEKIKLSHKNFDYSIEAWDIDPVSIRTARTGKYELKAFEAISEKYKKTLTAIVKSASSEFEIISHVKDRCRFKTVNISKLNTDNEVFDYIICRNVLIYFDAEDVNRIVLQLSNKIESSGYFCTGVSETSALNQLKNFLPSGAATYKNQKYLKTTSSLKIEKRENLTRKSTSKKILIVDDEPEIRELMHEALTEQNYPCFKAESAEEALKILQRENIGLILSDFRMPGKNGIELCKSARDLGYKNPFVIISGWADKKMSEDGLAVQCNEIILKPLMGPDLIRTVVSYIGRVDKQKSNHNLKPDILALGASTGGIEVLIKILSQMPKDSPPVMVVQHITAGFAKDFAERLSRVSGLPLGNIKKDEPIQDGHLYVPLGDYHMGVRENFGQLKLKISEESLVSGHRPSVDYLFESLSHARKNIFAVLLTGMGRDGAKGLLSLKNMGAETIAQDESSSVVFGMPKEAIKLDAAKFILNPDQIRAKILETIARSNKDTTKKTA